MSDTKVIRRELNVSAAGEESAACTDRWQGGSESEATMEGVKWELPKHVMLPEREVGRLIEHVKELNARDYVLYTLLANTGLRISEGIHVKAEDIIGDQIQVVRRKKLVLRASLVDVPVPLMGILKEWATMHDGYLFPGGAKPCVIRRRNGKSEQVCNGGHASIRTMQRRWELFMAELGLRMKGRGIHQLRHHFGTTYYNLTRDLRATQEALAHSSSTMTERYAHVVNQKENMAKFKTLL